ncbi:MAG: amidohydrolase family protein, partial [Gemmatimonadales bacterium]|nr:amidohydrolase family protein [Gemmatimonadales bacterium]
AALRRARADGRLTVRVSVYPPLGEWRAVADTMRAMRGGDDLLRFAGVKGYVDGSLGSTTALMDQPYLDEPASFGLWVTPRDSLARWIGGADSAGLQVVVHAIGDRANGELLDLYDSIGSAHGPRDRRFRIEHAQHLREADLARMARLGVIGAMQPYHAADDGRWAWKRIRPARIRTTYAFRSLLDAGARLAFGSDWTVAPVDPLLGIEAAVGRQTLDGKHPDGWVPEERISVEEALRAYTAGVSYAGFGERTRGVLREGMQADITVLGRDLFSLPAAEIGETPVVATVVGGRLVFHGAYGKQ